MALAATAIALTMTLSCKKKDDPSPSKTSLLVGKNWYVTSFTVNNADSLSSKPACEKDDYTTFKSDGTYTYTDAGTQCKPTGDDSGKWSFANNDTKLVMDDDTVNIDVLNSTTLTLSVNDFGYKVVSSFTAK